MHHQPAIELGRDLSIPKKTRLGVILFLIYLAIYAGFVVIGTLFTGRFGCAGLCESQSGCCLRNGAHYFGGRYGPFLQPFLHKI